MGKVVDKTKDPEAKKALDEESKDIEGRKRDAINAVVSSLDLPVKEELKEEPKEEITEEELKEITEEELKEIPDEDLTEEGQRLKKELIEKEEELIPKSKVEKRFKSLTEEIRKLKAKDVSEKVVDSDVIRLEKMSMEKLTTLRQNIRKETREGSRKIALGEDVDEKHLDDLDVLSDKIDDAVRTFSTRFRQKQVDLYNTTADEITGDSELGSTEEEIENACVEIKELAQTIYADYPKLQQSEEGQSLALRLAADHWKARKEFSIGKSKADILKRSHKKLLRKTTLDSNILKADKGQKRLDELRTKAGRGGTDEDRQKFVKEHPMFNVDKLIPDEFKGK